MTDRPQPEPRRGDEQRIDGYIKSFSVAARIAHDAGNEAAAAGLTEGVFHLIEKKNQAN